MLKQEASSYAAPALDKGLDILELLAAEQQSLTLKAIADALGRSKSELFRMVMVLHQRGYVVRDANTDAYCLSNRLFDLGLRTPRVRDLLSEAAPALSNLAEESGHSPHLVVLHAGETVVAAAVPGRSDMSFTLRLGYRRVAIDATSGQVIIAFQSERGRRRLIAESRRLPGATISDLDLAASLDRIRGQGFEMHESRDFVGITDICAPILGPEGEAIASIIVAYVNRHGRPARHIETLEKLKHTCSDISGALHGPAGRPPQ
jgi:DNA-binding IclR family transcriptional regulator